MSTIELKEQLISKIKITNDDEVLENVLKLLEFETNKQEIYLLNDEQKMALKKAQAEYVNGDFYTVSEADNITAQWLSK
jgi:hypothetical protein